MFFNFENIDELLDLIFRHILNLYAKFTDTCQFFIFLHPLLHIWVIKSVLDLTCSKLLQPVLKPDFNAIRPTSVLLGLLLDIWKSVRTILLILWCRFYVLTEYDALTFRENLGLALP